MAFATQNFLNAFLPSGRNACTLVKVELTDPSALTLYLASRPTTTPGSPPRFWQAALSDIGEVVEPGDLGVFDPGLATFDFRMSARPLAGQAVSDFSLERLASHYWYGATVTAYYWELGLASFSDALQIFKGVVIEYETEDNQARVYCQQRNAWIRRLPAVEVTRQKFPRAPEKSIGLPAGAICYGDLRSPPARAPASAYGDFQQGITSVVGPRRAGVRGTVVSLGKGGGSKGKVLFASHACKLFNSDVDGATPAIEAGDRLAEIDPIGGDVFNAASGTGFNFDDIANAGTQPFESFFPVWLLDSRQPTSNPGENPRAATDPFNETSYSKLDYDAGQRDLWFPIPDIPPQGQALAVKYVVGYQTSSGAGNLRVELTDGTTTAGTATLTASTTPRGQGGTLVGSPPAPIPRGSALVDDGWGFGATGTRLRIYFTGTATGQTARIFYVGIAIQFRPSWPVSVPSRKIQIPGAIDYRLKPGTWREGWGNIRHTFSHQPTDVWLPQQEAVDSEFYATLQGHADDGSGTYTGTADALIQRPPDILRHFLATYCAETLFETGGNPGDLVALRAALQTLRKTDMVEAFALDDFIQSSDVVRLMASSVKAWFFISCFTDKWSGIPWKADREVDFPRRLTRYDLLDPDGPRIIMHRDDVQNDLTVSYGWDAWKRRTMHETTLGPGRSISGHAYRNLRDEHMTVVANESDRLDFKVNSTTYVASLTPGDYQPDTLMQHVDAQMAAVLGNIVQLAWGMLIVSGYNDKINFNDGASKTATLTAGDFNEDPDGLAANAQTAMNAVSSNWTVTYSAATRKFTFDRSSGTKSMTFSNVADAALSFGFKYATTVAGPATSLWGVEPNTFLIGVGGTDVLSLPWETGANGIDAATPRACGALLGYDMSRDCADGTSYCIAHSPKGALEQFMATSVRRYGTRPPLNMALDYVNDTDTAREVRRRFAELWGTPPVEIQFETERMPDLQRGMVFDFDGSLDAVKPFAVPGTDGSWVGKKFVAVRPRRLSLPSPRQSVNAFWLPPKL